MATTIKVPELGESVTEGTIVRWAKQVGEPVRIGDVLLELETDKVNLEVGAESAGVLTRIDRKAGEDVSVGDTIGEIDETAEATVAPAAKESKAPAKSEAKKQTEPSKKQAAAASSSGDTNGKPGKSATETAAPPAAAPAREAAPEPPAARRPAPEPEKPQGEPVPPPPRRGERQQREERVKMSRRRRTIAERLVEAQQTAAILTTFNEIDMTRVMQLRRDMKEDFQQRFGIALGLTSFFVKAAVVALKEHPDVNAEIQGGEIVYKYYYDIGAAIDTGEGLVVPVVRDADALSFAEIEQTAKYFLDRARRGELALEDLRGGTFTISNGGVFGSIMSTPILNPPQVGILGLHRIQDRPVAIDGKVEIHPMMYVALSYDHRIIDGRTAVTFLARIKQLIEQPERLLLEG